MKVNLTGQEIGGYVIGQLIAEGGMGMVYQAFRPGSNEPLAIKVLITDKDEDDEYRHRFIREAKLMQALEHPHIMPVYGAGEQDNMVYFVMPFVRGPSLFELMGRRRFTPLTTWQILSPIAQALDYAHAHGIIHRDIKPGNVLVEPRKEETHHVYLLDFGLSKIAGARTLTKTGISVGTPHYMAPEQVLAKQLGPYTDVYALGVVLYEMLLGKVPFDAPRAPDLAFMHVRDAPPAPRIVNPDFPKPLEDVILRSLTKQPKDRYATAGELRTAYAEAVEKVAPEGRSMEYWTAP